MGRHQMASSSGRARVALGALPLVATVGAIGIGSAVMTPASSDAPLEPPAGNAPGGSLAPVPTVLPPGLPPAPVQVLDLAATGDPTASGASGATIGGARSGAAGGGSADGTTVRRATRAPTGGATTTAGRATTPRPATAAATGGGGSGSGGTADHGAGSGGGSGSSGGSGGAGSGGGSGNGGGSGGGGGLIGGVVGGLGSAAHSTVSGASSLLSFGDSSSVLSFG
jgi:hypothetical protein